ncbi:MAG: hypothetical protein AAF585_13185 [Verrucomicrobiota bacterium]
MPAAIAMKAQKNFTTLIACSLSCFCWADEPADPYNTLYDVMMARHASDGKAYAADETSPTIYSTSEFPYDDKTYEKFNAALDAFAALPQSKIETYSDIKRALLQRHLWKVFDWGHYKHNQPYRRAALQPKIASLIRRLALTREQILALPDTRAATVESGVFVDQYDAENEPRPFLPADLHSKGSWICLGDENNLMPTQIHSQAAGWSSVFLTFMRLPEGRSATLDYLKMVEKREEPFPVGTQFALVEQAFLISNEGELVLSPLVICISLRAYLDVEREFRRNRPEEPTQSVAEFVLQPRELMEGNAVMKAIHQDETRFEIADGLQCHPQADPFENGRIPHKVRLNQCMGCHADSGIDSIQTALNVGYAHFSGFDGPEAISKATAAQKREHKTWKALQEFWRKELGQFSEAFNSSSDNTLSQTAR